MFHRKVTLGDLKVSVATWTSTFPHFSKSWVVFGPEILPKKDTKEMKQKEWFWYIWDKPKLQVPQDGVVCQVLGTHGIDGMTNHIFFVVFIRSW